MKDLQLLSVVIPCLNSAYTLPFTLSSLFLGKFPKNLFEVLVVDNGSVDQTLDIARRYPVRTYSQPKRGAPAAMNLGIKNAKGDIICFTDSDCIIPHIWLTQISDYLNSHQDVDGVGGPILPYSRINKIQKLTGEIYLENEEFPTKIAEVRTGRLKGTLYGANMAYRREALFSVEGLDESITRGYTADLCWRLANKGRRIVFNPEIKTFHIFPWTLKSILKQNFQWGIWNAKVRKRYPYRSSMKEELERQIWPYLHITKSLLCLLSPSTKKLLKLCQSASFFLGQFYGHRAK